MPLNEGQGADAARLILARECLAPHAVSHWARVTPDAPAIQQVGGKPISYRELDRIARRWAAALRRIGVKRGTHVATLLPNGEHAQHAFLGIGWMAAVEVPVNAALTGSLLQYVLANSDATVLLLLQRDLPRVLELCPSLPLLKTIVVLDAGVALPADTVRMISGEEFLNGVEPAMDLDGPEYRDIAAIMYTSGTTGPSKGVLLPWATLYQTWSGAPEDMLPQGESIYCTLPLVHNSGRSCLQYALKQGARFVWRERFSGSDFWSDVRATGCTAASLVGPMLQFLYSQPARADDADNPLRAIFCGPLIADVESFKKRFDVRVATGYGMTEIGLILQTGWEHGPWQNCGRLRSDYPFPEARIVNEFDEPLGPGQSGELVVRVAAPWSISPGYYGMPEKTADAWRHGWFHTGDVMRRDADGWYYLIDRLKDSIRRRGENISSYEVESVVARYPGVTECAAIAVPAEHGEDEVMVVLQVKDAAAFDYAAFFSWVESQLPKFMCPRYAEAVDALPRNATTQRIKKYELRARGVGAATRDRQSTPRATAQSAKRGAGRG